MGNGTNGISASPGLAWGSQQRRTVRPVGTSRLHGGGIRSSRSSPGPASHQGTGRLRLHGSGSSSVSGSPGLASQLRSPMQPVGSWGARGSGGSSGGVASPGLAWQQRSRGSGLRGGFFASGSPMASGTPTPGRSPFGGGSQQRTPGSSGGLQRGFLTRQRSHLPSPSSISSPASARSGRSLGGYSTLSAYSIDSPGSSKSQQPARTPPPASLWAELEPLDTHYQICSDELALKAMERELPRHGLQQGTVALVSSGTEAGVKYHLKPVGERGCTNGRTHTSNTCRVSMMADGSMHYFCYSASCHKTVQIGFWADTWEWASLDQLQPAALQAFDPGLLRAYLELHQGMQRDKGVATKWKEYGSQKWTCFVNAYLSRFLRPVRSKRFEVVELRYDSAGNVQERLVMEPAQLK